MKFLLLAMLSAMPAAYAELYDGPNHPFNFRRLMGANLVLDFNSLPLNGRISDSRIGWSETYWPSNVGGIAYRWNHPNPQPFKYKLNTLEQLRKMSASELAQLSPAELYDIANDDYTYTLTRKALSLYTPRDLWWEGICHGWAQAATHFPEPAPVTVVNKAGIAVAFGASDVKGLLAMHEAYNFHGEEFGFVGQRCRVNGKVPGEGDHRDSNTNPPSDADANTAECRDVNAGTFHLIISNMLGLAGKSFVADIDRYNDVWNQPIIGYRSTILGEENVFGVDREKNIERRVRVKTTFIYGEELKFYTPELAAQGHRNFVSKLPVNGTPHQKILERDYEYILELNAAGNVVGGTWVTATRPDFMWNYAKSKRFKNSPMPLGNLGKIYRPTRLR